MSRFARIVPLGLPARPPGAGGADGSGGADGGGGPGPDDLAGRGPHRVLPPRILHVSETLRGGIAAYLDEIAPDQLARYGTTQLRFALPAAELGEVTRIPRACQLPLATGGRGPLALWRLARALRALMRREQPDIVHLHSSIAGALGRMVAPAGTRIVYCPHGFASARPGPAGRIAALVERLLAPHADAVLCISEHEWQEARRIGIPARRLRLIRSGIADLSGPVPALAGRRVPGPGPRLLFLGRLDPQKGFDILARAFELSGRGDLELSVVGAAVTDRRGHPLALPPGAVVHGWVPRALIPAHIAAADAVVMPSRWEGFGLVAVEAMRQGRAVLASRCGALPELVEDGVTGRLFLPEPEALARVLARLDRAELTAMGDAGRARYEALFRGERMTAGIAALYRCLEAEGREPGAAPGAAHG